MSMLEGFRFMRECGISELDGGLERGVGRRQGHMRVGMKVERKLSDFSAEKWKWNGNTEMEMETEFCGTEKNTEFLMWK
jgi:hypothetical protein